MAKQTAGQRLKELIKMTGLSQKEFADVSEMNFYRLKNIINGTQKMHDEDFEKVCSLFPMFAAYLTFEGYIDFEELNRSRQKLCKDIARRILAHEIPEGVTLEQHIKNMGYDK